MDPLWKRYENVCLLCHLNSNALGQHAVVAFLVHVVITLNLWSLKSSMPTISYSSDIVYTTHSLNEDADISLSVISKVPQTDESSLLDRLVTAL